MKNGISADEKWVLWSKTHAGCYELWDAEKIRLAHNRGHGTRKDFLRYIENNKKYVTAEKVSDSRLAEIQRIYG